MTAPSYHPRRHVLYDVLVPIFNMQHVFGVYTPDAQILIPQAVAGSEEELARSLPRLINTARPQDSLLRLTWDHDAAWVRDYARRVLDEGTAQGRVCFKVGGVGGRATVRSGYVRGLRRAP